MDNKIRLFIISYETPYTPCAGIAAVMKHLPLALSHTCANRVSVLSPFHYKMMNLKQFSGDIDFFYQPGNKKPASRGKAHILEDAGIEWFFLEPTDKRFFRGHPHPYALPQKDLIRDALLFGQMATAFLDKLQNQEKQLVMLKDWETAPVCLAGQEPKPDRRFFLVLHNTYDASASYSELVEAGYDPERLLGVSFLDQALPLVAEPVFTVSKGFASDITEDPLQKRVMAPHLTGSLKRRLIGVNNGPFARLSLDENLLEEMRQGDFHAFNEWKQKSRSEFISAVNQHEPDLEHPVWGRPRLFFEHTRDLPWMLMAGRADPNQKGYDLAAWAVENFLHNMGQAGFVFLPMPGERGFEDLGFISKLALKYPENILVLPFRLQKGYPQIIQACHFGLMPSFYEPFGMANEFYQNGCAGLGRATGGLASQIIDAEMDFSLCPWLVPKTQIKNSTGILFREEIFLEQADSLWQDIFNKNRKDNLQYRKQNPLYASMAKAMESSLFRAVDMCAQRPREFHQMILGGMDYINEAFSWERSAEIYWQTMNANIA